MSMSSKAARSILSRCRRDPEQIAKDAESKERCERIARWQSLCSKVGDRYSNCVLARWKYHGDQSQQDRQRAVISRVAEYMRQLPERVQGGCGVLLLGPPGTGKDFLVSALMREGVLAHGMKVEWANGVDLYAAFRDAISGETSEKKLVSQWVVPSVLVLSDPLPPRGALTDFQASMLFRIVDSRYRAMRPTWVTLNVQDRNEACDRMGSQVVSRLADSALTCRCEWQDFRSVVHK